MLCHYFPPDELTRWSTGARSGHWRWLLLRRSGILIPHKHCPLGIQHVLLSSGRSALAGAAFSVSAGDQSDETATNIRAMPAVLIIFMLLPHSHFKLYYCLHWTGFQPSDYTIVLVAVELGIIAKKLQRKPDHRCFDARIVVDYHRLVLIQDVEYPGKFGFILDPAIADNALVGMLIDPGMEPAPNSCTVLASIICADPLFT